ncbi:hypothetical protein GO290_02796 [Ralstonia solanacearum]|nr:hypothetical protein [Ralstonia solanacearum]
MTPTEFLEGIKPAARRSKLLPWLGDILTLRTAGCSIAQIRDYLAANGVAIGLSTLAAFVAKHAKGAETAAMARPAAAIDTPKPVSTEAPINSVQKDAPTAESHKSTEQLAKENPTLSRRAILDLFSRQFQKEPPNPLAGLLHKQEERKRLRSEQAAKNGAGTGLTTASG